MAERDDKADAGKGPLQQPRKPRGRDGAQSGAALSGDLQSHIGSRLRAYYDGIVKEPVPDRFLDLLDKLEQHEGEDGAGGGKRA